MLVESSDIPFGREKVITCYGIIGVLSLATSECHSCDYASGNLASCILRASHRPKLTVAHFSRLPLNYHLPNPFLPSPFPPNLPSHRLPTPPPLTPIHQLDHPRPPRRERAHLARRARAQIRSAMVLLRMGFDEHLATAKGDGRGERANVEESGREVLLEPVSDGEDDRFD